MSARWVNAVITVRVPTAIDPAAKPHEKQQAALNVEERVLDETGCEKLGAVIEIGFEDVEDGEPIEARRLLTGL